MIKRIINIIKRGKIKKPNRHAMLLLFEGLCKGLKKKVNDKLMILKKDSTFSIDEDLYMCSLFPEKVLELVCRELKPSSVLDVGCGTGLSLNFFLEKGIAATGLENSNKAINISSVKIHIIKHNLNNIYLTEKHYDLIWCFEVIEHIHPKYEHNFLQTLIHHSDNILLSAARPGQGGSGHFNEQEPDYWVRKFSKLGYENDVELTVKFRSTGEPFTGNILYFKKASSD